MEDDASCKKNRHDCDKDDALLTWLCGKENCSRDMTKDPHTTTTTASQFVFCKKNHWKSSGTRLTEAAEAIIHSMLCLELLRVCPWVAVSFVFVFVFLQAQDWQCQADCALWWTRVPSRVCFPPVISGCWPVKPISFLKWVSCSLF